MIRTRAPSQRKLRSRRSIRSDSSLDAYRQLQLKMIQETEVALTYGLRFPDRVPRIPTIEVGCGSFHPQFAERFWNEQLEIGADQGREKSRWLSLF